MAEWGAMEGWNTVYSGDIPVLIFKSSHGKIARQQAYDGCACIPPPPLFFAEIFIYPRQEIAIVHTRCCAQPFSTSMLPDCCNPQGLDDLSSTEFKRAVETHDNKTLIMLLNQGIRHCRWSCSSISCQQSYYFLEIGIS